MAANGFSTPHTHPTWAGPERLIGVASPILDAMLLKSTQQLTHEVLSTLIAKVMAIMNARPLVPVSTDPDNPTILAPTMFLTQKPNTLTAPSGNFDVPELYSHQWKRAVSCGQFLESMETRVPCDSSAQKEMD